MSSDHHQTCPDCGEQLESEMDGGAPTCPSCSTRVDRPGSVGPDASYDETLPLGRSRVQEPERIGPYRILQEVGEGGMGVVYLAEQERPLRRRVAIKIIKLGMDTRQVIARFESERQALALMSHPNVARVLDAGATEEGRPYFVMEYVPGIPITEYCDRQRLPIRSRLSLFLQACEAIQHAHHKGIIHRDVKPSNVLVAEEEGRPLVKVIDFGVAKATTMQLTAEPIYTRHDVVLGTPGYMSPEQAAPGGLEVDTRTDVYSLGVLLYELLVGVLPFDDLEQGTSDYVSVLRRIREEDAPAPSARLRELGREGAEIAEERGTAAEMLLRDLRGDLDWIALRALEKSPQRRYGSPAELAADLHRHLEDRPVEARPPSSIYRLQKLVRRRRGTVLAAATVAVALLVGAGGSFWQALRATRAERLARQEAETAQQVSDFLVELFTVSDPGEARGNTVTAREILDRGSERIAEELGERPVVRARLMATMGHVYGKLGLYTESEELLESALQTYQEVLGQDADETLGAMVTLTDLRIEQGRFDEAEVVAKQVLELSREKLGEEDVFTLAALNNLAGIYQQQGRYDEAVPILQQSLEASRRQVGDGHPDTLRLMNNLAGVYEDLGRYDEAVPLYVDTLAGRRRALGEDHPETLTTVNNLAWAYMSQKRYREAEEPMLEAAAGFGRVLGADHPQTLIVRSNLGRLYLETSRFDQAEPLLRDVLERSQASFPPGHWFPEVARYRHGRALVGLARFEEAEREILAAHRALASMFQPEHDRMTQVRRALVELYEAWDRPLEAAAYR